LADVSSLCECSSAVLQALLVLLPSVLHWRVNNRDHLQPDLMACKGTAGTGRLGQIKSKLGQIKDKLGQIKGRLSQIKGRARQMKGRLWQMKGSITMCWYAPV